MAKDTVLDYRSHIGLFAIMTAKSTYHPARVVEFEGEPARDWMLTLVRPECHFLGAVAIRGEVTAIRAYRLLAAELPVD